MVLPYLPRTAAELKTAVTGGVLTEGASFDAKERIAPGERANRELAIDLAAMSVNGGLIAIGIAEVNGSRQLAPKPGPLSGLRERVSQIGLSRVDPPLYVQTIELPDSDSGDSGYLLIVVPPSPNAPHQVEGRYRGRSDTTNYVLSDADVRRIQAQRQRARPNIDEVLDDAVRRDPSPPELRHQAHLFVVGRPVVPTSSTMLQETLGSGWRTWILTVLVDRPSWAKFSPDLPNNTTAIVRRPRGWAAIGSQVRADRSVGTSADENYLLELEVDEDGGPALFCGRGSDLLSGSSVRWTFEHLIGG